MAKLSDKKSQIKEIREQEAEELAKILSVKYKLPYLNLATISIDLDALRIVPEDKARSAKLAVFQKNDKKLDIAIFSPNLESTQNTIKELEQNDFRVKLYMVSESSLNKVWKRYREVPEFVEISKGIIDVSQQKLEEFMEKAGMLEDLRNIFFSLIDSKKVRRVSETLEIIIAGAISSDSSDIHIEPQEGKIRLRFRLDGVLHDILFFDPKIYNLVLSRIKLVSGLKLNVHNQAQDGRFSVRIKDLEIEIRTSIIPGPYGESVVMRILNPKSINVALEDLGMEKHLYEVTLEEIKKPNGMLLTTGPTGSGKTTTLYSFLKKIYSPGIKIITLEDPIEYHLTGITQTQIDDARGYGFAEGLRAILRQDPDIIMVGEIRDLETAKIAMNAALTGHFVFSTLHTNNAGGTIPRLIDIGVNPAIIAPALNMSMAQRLVRKLCNNCKVQKKPTDQEKEKIKQILDSFPKNIPVQDINQMSIWESKGCRLCNNIGYKGRIGVFEAILINPEIENLILHNPSETEIWKAAKMQGLLDMRQDGIIKVLKGITSFDELRRVVEL
ncbi:MAG: GspE/PulE family protein [Patescibacteria group bacterium]